MIPKETKNSYLRCWWDEDDNGEFVRIVVSSKREYLRSRVVFGGIHRGEERVFVYVTHWNMDNPLSKQEMQAVARKWLDGDYKTNEVNLGSRL